jgi:serine protease Do
MALAILLASSFLTLIAAAQALSDSPAGLSRDRFKSGAATLESFAPIAEQTRYSVVKLDIDGSTVALGAIIDAGGLALTKGSEIREGKLTCWLPGGKEVDAELVGIDEENDVALVKVHADGLKPVEWSSQESFVGQWAVTPGIETTPQAVGIVSVPPRKILHKRALIGVQLDFKSSAARIAQIMAGLGAEKAGLKPGDVILAVNDAPVNKREELTKTLRNFREGQSVRLRVRRDEQEMDAEVRMMSPNPERFGRGFDRSERMNRLGGGLSGRAEGFALAIQHDTVLQPWQCGGPLVNLEGKAIGLNIARAGRVASYALPAELVKQIRDTLTGRTPAN